MQRAQPPHPTRLLRIPGDGPAVLGGDLAPDPHPPGDWLERVVEAMNRIVESFGNPPRPDDDDLIFQLAQNLAGRVGDDRTKAAVEAARLAAQIHEAYLRELRISIRGSARNSSWQPL